MKNLLIILTVTTLFACSKSDDKNDIENFYNFGVKLEFSVFNSQNEDLLNPENPNHLNTSNFKLFYLIDGEKQEVYDSNLEYPRNIKIYKHETEDIYRVRVFLNFSDSTDKPTTYIQWNESDTDTIEATYKRFDNGVLQDIIWLNGEQIWERGNNTIDPYFVLIK